jgi:biotin--protein ligase
MVGEQQKIFIYNDLGVSQLLLPAVCERFSSGWHPVLVDAAAIAGGALEGADILVVPGGRDVPYHAALAPNGGNRAIRRFVEGGGTYIGICAGAYYGCARLRFDEGGELFLAAERELGFYPGEAVGPAYGTGTYDYGSTRGCRAAPIAWEGGTLPLYYHGGCLFQGSAACVVLARYAELPGAPPAIIECAVGKGRAILSGVHFEVGPSHLDEADPRQGTLAPLLSSYEEERRRLFAFLMRRCTYTIRKK